MSNPPEASLVEVRVKTSFLGSRQWLNQAGSLRVIHVFERAINLADGRGRLISLIHPDLDPGPFHILPDTWPFEAGTPTTHTAVGAVPDGIKVDRWLFNISAARLWDARPAWKRIRGAFKGEKRARFLEFLKSREIRAAISIPKLPRYWTPETAAAFSGYIAGLGPGLTPSGDDFLMGLIHGLWLTHSTHTASRVARWLIDAAVPRTTTLSSEWLRSAARGEAGAPWHSLFHALEMDSFSKLSAATEKILQTGHTSGADALAGFLAGSHREGENAE